MTTTEKLIEAAKILNEKYSFINDFHVYKTDNLIKGGFYKTSYVDDIGDTVEYYFHETFFRLEDEAMSVQGIVDYISKNIDKQLTWQKWSDEQYAKDFNKEVVYQYDYSNIPD